MSAERGRTRHRIHRLPPKEDVEKELRFHLERREEELIGSGWDPVSARQEAQRLFGNYAAINRECGVIAERHVRTMRRSRVFSEVRQDLKYAVRGLVRAPGFALLAIATLALGIGANTAAFSIVNGVLLAPLPYSEPDRLVALWEVSRSGTDNSVTWPNFRDIQRDARTVSSVAVYQQPWRVTVLGGVESVRAPVARVSASLFDVLDVQPAMGRGFAAEEMVPGGPPTVLVSEGFWRDQLGAPSDLTNVTLDLYGVTARVIGVMPRDFDFPRGAGIWFPVDIVEPGRLGTRTAHNFRAVARLAPGASIDIVRDDLTRIIAQIREQEPDMTAHAMSVYDLRDDSVGGSRRALMILLGASAFVLLIACTNLASSLLARAARRRQELAIRASLGAHRMRLVRQLMTESGLLSVLGAIAGLALASVLIRIAIAMGPNAVPRLHSVVLDGRVLIFTMLIAVITAVMFGTMPALRATRARTHDAVRSSGRGTQSGAQRRAWSWLVSAEVALALLLLVGSGLLIRSFQQITRINPGFETSNRLTVQVSLPQTRYADGSLRAPVYDRLLERVRALPGVENAAITYTLPLVDFDPNGRFDIEGGEDGDGDAAYRVVSETFFATMGMPLLRGRDFSPADRLGAEDVIIINDQFARTFFPGEDPIGRRMRTGGMDSRGFDFATIIGVVGDVRSRRIDVPAMPGYYLAYAQRPDALLNMTLVVHGSVNPVTFTTPIRDIVREIEADAAIEVGTLTERVGASFASRRFMLFVLGSFAAIALTLSAVGIYGVVAFAVAARTREVGIRMALGASGRSVLWTVSRGTMLSVGIGVLLGLVGAAWLSRLIVALLYDTTPTDPATFATVALILFGVASIAMFVPAYRAVRVDPQSALRVE